MFDADGGGTLSAKELMCGLRDKEMPSLRKARRKKVGPTAARDVDGRGRGHPRREAEEALQPHGDQRVKEGNAEWPPRDVMNVFCGA